MEAMIELTEVELDLVTGGLGVAAFSFMNIASGTTIAVVASTFNQVTTDASASQEGTFTSVSA